MKRYKWVVLALALVPLAAWADPPSWGAIRRVVGELEDQLTGLVTSGVPVGRTAVAGGLEAADANGHSVWQISCPANCCLEWEVSTTTANVTVGYKITAPLAADYVAVPVTNFPADDALPVTTVVSHDYMDNDPAGDMALVVLAASTNHTHPRTCVSAGKALAVWTTDDNEVLALAVHISEYP